MKVAYIRVSTDRQDLTFQLEAIKATNPDKIYKDIESGTSSQRKAYTRLLGDIALDTITEIVVWKLDRLSRDFFATMELFYTLSMRGIIFISITEPFLSGKVCDYTMEKKILLSVIAAKAEMEARDTRMRTQNIMDKQKTLYACILCHKEYTEFHNSHCSCGGTVMKKVIGRPSKAMRDAGWTPKPKN